MRRFRPNRVRRRQFSTTSPALQPLRITQDTPTLSHTLSFAQWSLGCLPFGRQLVPDFANDASGQNDHRLAAVGGEVVQHQMDDVGLGVVGCDLQQEIGELGRLARGRRLGEVPSLLGFDGSGMY